MWGKLLSVLSKAWEWAPKIAGKERAVTKIATGVVVAGAAVNNIPGAPGIVKGGLDVGANIGSVVLKQPVEAAAKVSEEYKKDAKIAAEEQVAKDAKDPEKIAQKETMQKLTSVPVLGAVAGVALALFNPLIGGAVAIVSLLFGQKIMDAISPPAEATAAPSLANTPAKPAAAKTNLSDNPPVEAPKTPPMPKPDPKAQGAAVR
jgi:hypothetical protein